jgi:NAD-dependent deacetylase sirtuin 4
MRISVPGLPSTTTASSKPTSPVKAYYRLSEFLSKGNVAVLTGAGVSVDSGIRAYRGHDGRYMNPNYRSVFLPLLTYLFNEQDDAKAYILS